MRVLCLLFCVLATGTFATEPPAQTPARPDSLIPIEHFFVEPDLSGVQVSPEGKHLAFLTTLGTGRVGIALMDLATGKIEPLVAAQDENYGEFLWKGPDHIVFGGDLGGNESLALRSIKLSNRKVVSLAESYRERYSDRANQASVVDSLRFDPYHLLIFGNQDVGSWNFRLFRLDIRTGDRTAQPYEPALDTTDLTFDNAGNTRTRIRYSGEKALFEHRPINGTFSPIREFPANGVGWKAVAFAADNENLYLLTHDDTDTNALRVFNTRTRALGPVLFNSPDGEINRVLLSWDCTRLYGVLYTTDKPHYHWFDVARAKLQAQIDASLPGTFNEVVSATPDEQLLVVYATSDLSPGAYYLLDRRRTALMQIGRINSHLDPAKLRPMQPITYPARDGLVIHGYLTLPAGAEGQRVPLILNPHGGPYNKRDVWGFNPEVQFLASRGYAVLQVNYRGSGGYGQRFLKAGMHEWGRKMQDDLTDAVQWAIAQGIADPGRVAICGASYGGYAALAGVTFTPELYRCAVNYVGVSDLSIFNRFANEYGAGRDTRIYFSEWVDNDLASLHARSPVNFVERIRVPTLHAYGENDPRVDIDHWKRLKTQLDKYHKPYEFLRVETEGHGFRKEENRLRFYRAVETFLATNLREGSATVEIKPVKVLELPARETK